MREAVTAEGCGSAFAKRAGVLLMLLCLHEAAAEPSGNHPNQAPPVRPEPCREVPRLDVSDSACLDTRGTNGAGAVGHEAGVGTGTAQPAPVGETVVGSTHLPGPGETSLHGTGSKLDIELLQLPATVNVVSMERARQRGVSTLNEALSLVPGLTPNWEYGGFQQIRSRGFRAVVLRDGIRDNRSTFVNSHPQSGLWDLERIEVLKGPPAALYGYGALGGVVNLVRKRPLSKAAYEFDLGLGTPRQRLAHFGATGPIAEGLRYRLDVGHTGLRDFRDHSTERNQGTASLAYRPAAGHQLLARASLYKDRYNTDSGVPTVLGSNGNRELPPLVQLDARYNSAQDFLDYQRLELELGYEWYLGRGVSVRERLAYSRDEYEYFSTEGLTYVPGASSPDEAQVNRSLFYFFHHWFPLTNQLELTADFAAAGLSHRLLFGYEVDLLLGAHSERATALNGQSIAPVSFRSPLERQPPVAIRHDASFRGDMAVHGLYLHDHIELPLHFTLVLGGRMDHFSFKAHRENLDPETGAIVDETAEDSRVERAFTYRAGLVHRPLEWLSYYASWGTSFEPNAALRPLPERRVAPERGAQLELGSHLQLGEGVALNLAAYEIRKTNVTVPLGADRFDTAGEVRSRGVEFDVRYEGARFTLEGGYAYTHALFERFLVDVDGVLESLAGNTPPFVADHTASAWLSYRPWTRMGLALGGRALGRQYADERNQLRLAPYWIADTSIWFDQGLFRLSLTANNLLGRRNYFVSSIENNLTPGPPRELLAQLRVAF